MSDDNIIPYISPEARRAAENAHTIAPEGEPNIEAIEKLLIALEGMENQLHALINLVVEQDKRIEKLEKSKPGRIISAR